MYDVVCIIHRQTVYYGCNLSDLLINGLFIGIKHLCQLDKQTFIEW